MSPPLPGEFGFDPRTQPPFRKKLPPDSQKTKVTLKRKKINGRERGKNRLLIGVPVQNCRSKKTVREQPKPPARSDNTAG